MPEVNEPLPDLATIQAELEAAIQQQNETLSAIAAKLNDFAHPPVKPSFAKYQPMQPIQRVSEAESKLIYALYRFAGFEQPQIKHHQAQHGNASGDITRLAKAKKHIIIDELEQMAVDKGLSLNDFYSFGLDDEHYAG